MKRKIIASGKPSSFSESVRTPEPCTIAIFGASGDLAHRKLIPALYDLYCENRLPKNFSIVGFSRSEWNDERFRKEILSVLKNKPNRKQHTEFINHLYYRIADPADSDSFRSLAD